MQQVSEAPSIAGPGHNLATTADILSDRFAGIIKEADGIAAAANEARDALGETGKVASDEQRDPLISIGIKAAKLAKRLDETRLDTTKPLRDEVSETNNFFNAMISRMQRVQTAFEELVGRYDRAKRDEERRKAAEAARVAEEEARRKLEEAEKEQGTVVGDAVLEEAVQAEERAQHLASVATLVGTGPTRTDAGTVSATAPWTHVVEDWSKVDLTEIRDQFTVAEIEKAIRAHVRKFKNTRPLKGVRIFQDEKTKFRG
jgi:hypothetical protein